jgi:hypothetical protein
MINMLAEKKGFKKAGMIRKSKHKLFFPTLLR